MKKAPKKLWALSVVSEEKFEEDISDIFRNIFQKEPVTYIDSQSNKATVSIYFEDEPPPEKHLLLELQKALAKSGLPNSRLHIKQIKPTDWAESWKHHFRPIAILNSIIIRPSWSTVKIKPGQVDIVLDPGLSFGTGHHPTTLYCLQELARTAKKGKIGSFLDIGTGTGILAITAAKLKFHPVVAFDNDPVAIKTAKTNAQKNRVNKNIHFMVSDCLSFIPSENEKFDLVCANIQSDILIKAAAQISACIKLNGNAVLAGILDAEFAEVKNAFSKYGLVLLRSRKIKEWRSGLFSKSLSSKTNSK